MARYGAGDPSGFEPTTERMKSGRPSLTPWTPDPSLGHLLHTMRKVGPKIGADETDLVLYRIDSGFSGFLKSAGGGRL